MEELAVLGEICVLRFWLIGNIEGLLLDYYLKIFKKILWISILISLNAEIVRWLEFSTSAQAIKRLIL